MPTPILVIGSAIIGVFAVALIATLVAGVRASYNNRHEDAYAYGIGTIAFTVLIAVVMCVMYLAAALIS